MTVQRARKTYSAIGAFLATCILALALMVCAPSRAWALFYDYSDADAYSGVASRGNWSTLLASMGDVLLPQDIPDGTYLIDAATTSTMCWIFPTASDCSARYHDGEWGHCTLQVSGGTMTVYLYISQAYTHLYWGTAAEAASVTDSTGCDASNYISGNPNTGYVPHYFAFNIPALNWPMDIATYGGNEQLGFEGHQWWNRVIVFKATQDVYNAIYGASVTPEPEPEPEPEPPDSGASDYEELINRITEETDGINARIDDLDDGGNGDSGGQPDGPDPGGEEGGDGTSEYDDLINRVNELTEELNGDSTASEASPSPTGGTTTTTPTAQSTETANAASATTTKPKTGSVVIPVTFDQLRQTDDTDSDSTEEETPQFVGGLTLPQVMGLAALGILALGALVRVGIFLMSKRR